MLDISRVQNTAKTQNWITISAKSARCLMKFVPENDSIHRPVFCRPQAPRRTLTTARAGTPFIVAIDASLKFFDSRSLCLMN